MLNISSEYPKGLSIDLILVMIESWVLFMINANQTKARQSMFCNYFSPP